MSDGPAAEWGFLQWAGSIAVTIIGGLIGHLHFRLNRQEEGRERLRMELMTAIDRTREEGRDGLNDLKSDILSELRLVRTRTDDMVTKGDLRDLLQLMHK